MQISTYVVDNGSWVSLMMNDGDELEMSEKEQIRKRERPNYLCTVELESDILVWTHGVFTHIWIDKK